MNSQFCVLARTGLRDDRRHREQPGQALLPPRAPVTGPGEALSWLAGLDHWIIIKQGNLAEAS